MTDHKEGITIFEFYNGDRWVLLTKETGKCFAPETLRDRFSGVNTMKNFLGVDKTLPALEISFKAAIKLNCKLQADIEMESIPPKELSSLV